MQAEADNNNNDNNNNKIPFIKYIERINGIQM